ncbi:SAM domain-containing protein [Bradyrhizobium australiense]|uniref:SAM domain-containing protein n=1 Tax=Bradyrhizobium australiense TaxID=2721161 RepID=UPI001AEE3237|nr:SAM domain-containing protein [Bradyrhizobium australiense]
MQSIAHWLHALGFEQYAQRFAENENDLSVLPHLTDQDLKDIGIPLGHRAENPCSHQRAHFRGAGRIRTLCCFNAVENLGRRGTPPAYGHVRRPRRLHGLVRAA